MACFNDLIKPLKWIWTGINNFWMEGMGFFWRRQQYTPIRDQLKLHFASFPALSVTENGFERVALRDSPCLSSRQGPVTAASRQVSEAEAKSMLHTHRAVPLHSTIYLSFVAHNWGWLQMAQLHRLYTVKSLFSCVNSWLLPWPGKKTEGQESPTNKPWFIKGEKNSGLISSLGNQARLNLLCFMTISVGSVVAVTGMLPITSARTKAKRKVQKTEARFRLHHWYLVLLAVWEEQQGVCSRCMPRNEDTLPLSTNASFYSAKKSEHLKNALTLSQNLLPCIFHDADLSWNKVQFAKD